jgi:putative endonuclease
VPYREALPSQRAAHLKAGVSAENLACRWLQNKGLQLLQRNYRCRYGELDLVMHDGDCLVIVEVRYRKNRKYGGSIASITHEKRRRIIRSSACLLQQFRRYRDYAVRIDVIGLTGNNQAPDVEWISNAFTADEVR